ncbi:c-type cytochrome [Paraburkholderia sp. BL10I2N1]|uniref:c-type cytochrome n=1 Tax=Paraburkholderia sp. BL10I2N1 TaxID=1938796 RepID=UPI0010614FA6|nr:c-type cytochrome [Paraburkholderia sp. BL10I2N1]TDN66984.1 cytochrome c [Paraburkholderia sp. BL10I2N1]
MNRKSYAALALIGTLVAGGTASAQKPAVDGLALATAQNCMSCHSVNRPLMGPTLHDIAAKYAPRGDAATSYLSRKIVEGSSGIWGPVPMPANTQLTPDQAVALANWILSLR